ncbi:hypothetical protein TWF694_005512 [Orbilia ellipsospora]|uniref:Tyrosinase C-terminal domain-containing protein n=1 Tax=Orbilia ellipsospora TaxID=2528407 RepID=A0AAV9WTD1_9PEZI
MSHSRTEIQYNCQVTVNQASLNGSWAIYLFFGTPPSDTSDWPRNNVGMLSILGQAPGVPNRDRVVSQSDSLTWALRHSGIDTEGKTGPVVEYLEREFVWGVSQNDPTADRPKLINPKDLRDVKLVVSKRKVEYPDDLTQKPTFGQPLDVLNVTEKSYWPDGQ